MERAVRFFVCILAVALAAAPGRAAEPQRLDERPFEVLLTDEAGAEKSLFGPRETLYFDIRFVLTMSEVNRYPVTVTLIQQWGRDTAEQVLYQGQLTEGVYRLRQPLDSFPASSGEVAVKMILKTRVYNRGTAGQESFYSYRRWEGSYRIGRR